MLRLSLLSWAAAASLAFFASTVEAWNSIGHLAVGKLAYDRLSDADKAKLFVLLKNHPHYEAYLAANRPTEVSEVEWVLVRSGVWPDWVRPRKKDTRGHEVLKYNRPEDHYVNVPFVDPKDEAAFTGKTLVDPDLTNILDALKQRSNEVRTKTADAAEKAVALCWIAHLVGDIHQPLHNVSYFSNTKDFRTGDLGGNRFGVRVNGRGVKLHAYWDNLPGDDPNYEDDSAERQRKIYQQVLKIAATLRNLQLPEKDQEKLVRNKTFASWSLEGFELAKSVSYRKSDGSGV
ncbi:MAG: S1/P1 nuclease, partial [Gemmataceae bacterium]|nr:S1/P1 nuclease [Gemmataceae bacterium]